MKKALYLKHSLCAAAMIAAGWAGTCTAFAQEANAGQPSDDTADAEPTGFTDIIVTAQKRSERLRDVPLSITAASGDQLGQLNVTTAEGLAKITPGFTALTTGYGTPVLTIRGVGYIDVSVAAAPAVSLYVDQVPLPFGLMSAGATLDVERVEVLKGPQGTLFGQNSTGGAINYIAAKPGATFEAGGDVVYGRFDRFDVNAYVSGPISDTLRARVAVRSEQRGDWQRSYTRKDSLGQRDFLAGRILLDWTPTERLSLRLNVNGWRDKSDTVAQQFIGYQPTNPTGYPEAMIALQNYPIAPRNGRDADWDAGGDFTRNDTFYQIALQGDWEISDTVTLSSISSLLRYDPDIPVDGDGTNYTDINTRITGSVKTWTQELRLAGDAGPFKWMLGGNYERDITRERDDLGVNATNSGIGPFRYNRIFIDNAQDIKTAAIFGSVDYKVTETLTAQISGRYTDQRRDFDGCLRDPGDGRLAASFSFLATALSGRPVTIPAGACVTFADASPTPVPIVSNKFNEDNFSWRAGLNWKADPNTLVYANVAQGYKAGGYSTLPGVRVAQYKPAVQEKVIAYEAGVKTSFLDNIAQLDGALFYYDYSNKQIRGFINTGAPFGNLPVLVNIPKSDVRGAEFSVTLRPSRRLTVISGLSYVDTRVRGSFAVNDQGGQIVDARGQAFPSAPKWQLSGDVQYEVPFNADWNAFVGGHLNYRSATTAFLGGNPFFDIAGYTLIDLRAGVESQDGAWRVQIFGDNITNKYYTNNVTRPIDAFARIAGMPATYGIKVGFRFR